MTSFFVVGLGCDSRTPLETVVLIAVVLAVTVLITSSGLRTVADQ